MMFSKKKAPLLEGAAFSGFSRPFPGGAVKHRRSTLRSLLVDILATPSRHALIIAFTERNRWPRVYIYTFIYTYNIIYAN